MKKRTYDEWRKEVESHIEAISGMDSEFLPDYDFQKAYKEGKSPLATAKACLAAARRY